MHKEGNRTVESAVEARGGLLGRPVLLVLVVSILLALAAMALSYAGFFQLHSHVHLCPLRYGAHRAMPRHCRHGVTQ